MIPLQSPEFRFVTEDALREWKGSVAAGFKLPEPVPVARFLYELCWAVVRGDLPIQKCKAALDSVEFADEKATDGVSSDFADVLAHMAQDPSVSGDRRARLVKLAKWLVDSLVVPHRLLQERCEEEFLWEAELVKINAQDLRTKEIRVNTRLLYQQTKFNLLREESEGYAKLVTLLSQSSVEATARSTPTSVLSTIKSLIGHFDLDPNRVFDIVLEFFELNPDCNIFYSLIPSFPKSNASQILGFKFQYYQRMEVKSPVPFGLYRLAALLVKAELVDLESVCAHLLPKDGEAFDHYSSFLANRLDEVNKIGKINLAATGKDLMDEEKQEATTDLFLALDMEKEATMGRTYELESNQWLGLLVGFLSVDDWYHANVIFDRLSQLNPVEHLQICNEMLRVIEKTISPAYATISQIDRETFNSIKDSGADSKETPNVSPVHNSYIELPQELSQMLSLAGPYLYRDALLLQKVCRVLKGYYLSAKRLLSTPGIVNSESGVIGSRDVRTHFKETKMRVEEALGKCLLPSLQLIPANPAIGQEIWEVLSLLPYEVRYRLYGEWEKEDEQLPVILTARLTAKLETRRILKRLAKENLKQKGRMVAKLAHANPMTVLRTIVQQIEAYKDMIAPVVDAFKYLTQLEYDILEYVVIERLAQGGRDKLKDDGLNLSDWLQSLASFWGHLCKKYPSMELRGLFQYLVNQLKRGVGIELVVLQELVQQMANVQYTENMTEEQLDAMAGSETLRSQVTSFGTTRNNKALLKSTNRLRDSLLPKDEPKLAIPLLLLIAQHRSMVVINADAQHIKLVSEQFDRCHGTLLQYVDFLVSALNPVATYAQLIPTLDDLVLKYYLDPEVAFLIYRPVMRLFKCSSRPEILWPLDSIDEERFQNSENGEILLSSDDLILDLGQSRKSIMWSDLLNTIRLMLPAKAWNSLSPDLYATFWGLTLYDLYVPKNCYGSEISKQHVALKILEEVSDNSSSAIAKRKKDKERIQELLDKLTGELKRHEQHVASVRQRLTREKDKWLSSCPDTLKINMEFFQRCIFPRCIFSMTDAVYCAVFVQTLHSLGTPYFNTVNHIDILICKTLQPMICCCTEYEAGRLGRFLYETLKMAYHWKNDESIYERECGNMPGFAVYYRYPNSQRVTFGQFVRVHAKWSTRLTKLFIQCLESSEYMEIRNALITLTKISSVFPVTRRSGVNLEKRVVKIKLDEREDLKVLATGVAAALAARKSSWVSEEEFGMGFIDPKPSAKSYARNLVNSQNGFPSNPSTSMATAVKSGNAGSQPSDSVNAMREPSARTKTTDGRVDRNENNSALKSELPSQKGKSVLNSANSDLLPSTVPSSNTKPSGSIKNTNDLGKAEESLTKSASKPPVESELKPKRSTQTSISKQRRQDAKEDVKTAKPLGRSANQTSSATGDREPRIHFSGNNNLVSTGDLNSNTVNVETSSLKPVESRLSSGKDMDNAEVPEVSRPSSSRLDHDDFHSTTKRADKQQRRSIQMEEQDRLIKRRKGENEAKDAHLLDHERSGSDEPNQNKLADKHLSKDKVNEKHDKDNREKNDRADKTRSDDILGKTRDRSMERYGRERSVERMQERGERSSERPVDKFRDDRNKDDRIKPRRVDGSSDKMHPDERFNGQGLPPPPPFLPTSFVPQSIGATRREEDGERRTSSTRHGQRLSPRHDEKERRHSEEILLSHDEAKRKRDDDFRERKHDERDTTTKVDDREKDKGNAGQDDIDGMAMLKRRKIKRELSSGDAGREFSPVAPPSHSPHGTQPLDGDRGDRKGGAIPHRASYSEDTTSRIHGKEASKSLRNEMDQTHEREREREREEEKRLRIEAKRKHRK